MKKVCLGLAGLFLLPQTALAVDAAAPVSQEEKPDELDIDLLLEEIKRM